VLLNTKCLIITRTVIILTKGEALIRRRLAPRVIIEEGVRLMISGSLTALYRHFGSGIKTGLDSVLRGKMLDISTL